MEKNTECGVEDGGGGTGDSSCVSIPRGGPIYVPDMLSPLTRVSSFESSLLQLLQNLQTELCSDLPETCNEDLSVDELKIITEEELVNKAFEEALKDSEVSLNCSLGFEEHSNARREDDGRLSSRDHIGLESSGRGNDASTSEQSLNDSPLRTGDKGKLSTKIAKHRKRKGCCTQKSHSLDGSYIAKVELLMRMKQKQDEDKAAARLHSFNCRSVQCANTSSEKIERLTSLKSTSYKSKVRPSNTCEHVPVLYPEVVLCIEVYHNKQNWVKTKEFLVLGRQPLTELRDKIYCLTDEIMKKAGQHDPSGYFLIEKTFCNDLRDPSAIDYSEPIFNWLRNSKKEAREKWECIISGELQQKQKSLLGSVEMPQFKAVDMHNTRFCDLRFRLGAGYLYCHQGDCKHIIVIRDMRMIHPEDVQNRAAYPLVTFQMKFRAQKCSVCKIYLAEKVTVDDKWAPANPCYFCDVCYYMLHYSNQSLLYNDFSVYDYFHEQ